MCKGLPSRTSLFSFHVRLLRNRPGGCLVLSHLKKGELAQGEGGCRTPHRSPWIEFFRISSLFCANFMAKNYSVLCAEKKATKNFPHPFNENHQIFPLPKPDEVHQSIPWTNKSSIGEGGRSSTSRSLTLYRPFVSCLCVALRGRWHLAPISSRGGDFFSKNLCHNFGGVLFVVNARVWKSYCSLCVLVPGIITVFFSHGISSRGFLPGEQIFLQGVGWEVEGYKILTANS